MGFLHRNAEFLHMVWPRMIFAIKARPASTSRSGQLHTIANTHCTGVACFERRIQCELSSRIFPVPRSARQCVLRLNFGVVRVPLTRFRVSREMLRLFDTVRKVLSCCSFPLWRKASWTRTRILLYLLTPFRSCASMSAVPSNYLTTFLVSPLIA